MDFVIFVKSCGRDRDLGFHEAIRETWGAWSEFADIRFIMGATCVPQARDEIRCHAVDDWNNLWQKTREANRLALAAGYTWAFHACTDTYTVVPRLVALATSLNRPYIGCATPDHHLSGGAGYVLRRDAMEHLATKTWHPDYEDKEVYDLLDGGNGFIRPTHVPFFRGSEPNPWDKETVSVHLSTHRGSLTRERLYECDRNFMRAFGDSC